MEKNCCLKVKNFICDDLSELTVTAGGDQTRSVSFFCFIKVFSAQVCDRRDESKPGQEVIGPVLCLNTIETVAAAVFGFTLALHCFN